MEIDNVEELAFNIAKETDLSYDEFKMLIHDINNLRADKWLEIIEDCTEETKEQFYQITGIIVL